MNSLYTCPSSQPRVAAGLLTVLLLGSAGCPLVSIDPDVLDHADEVGTENGQDDGTGDEGFETSNATDDDVGEGTGTAAEEDTDDEGTDEIGNDEFGTDTTDDSESDTFDTDASTDSGDTSDTSDSDTGELICEASEAVGLGDTDVFVVDGPSNYEGSCGGGGAETLYSFTAPAGGDYYFSLSGAEFTAVIHLLDETCAEIADACSSSGEPVHKTMSAGDTVVVVVDSDGGTGSATLTISGP